VDCEELREVLAARWAIPAQGGRDLGGSLNLNLLVGRGGEQLVARVHRPSVSPVRLEAIQAVRDRLNEAGVPCSALVSAVDGAGRAWAGDRLVEVERFIPHDGAMNNTARLARGLPLLGRIHALLAGIVAGSGRGVRQPPRTQRRARRHPGRRGPDPKLAPDTMGTAHGRAGGAARRPRRGG
jgi:phosphotransferase family enzyme